MSNVTGRVLRTLKPQAGSVQLNSGSTTIRMPSSLIRLCPCSLLIIPVVVNPVHANTHTHRSTFPGPALGAARLQRNVQGSCCRETHLQQQRACFRDITLFPIQVSAIRGVGVDRSRTPPMGSFTVKQRGARTSLQERWWSATITTSSNSLS